MKELIFSIPEVECEHCGEKIDPDEAVIMVIMVCPCCQEPQGYGEDAVDTLQ